MENSIVTYETAKLAKEKGFNEICQYYYDENCKLKGIVNYNKVFYSKNSEIKYLKNLFYIFHKNKHELFTVPTQSLLQKWLREKYDIHIYLELDYNHKYYGFKIISKRYDIATIWNFIYQKSDFEGNSYEEALEKGLQEALNII